MKTLKIKVDERGYADLSQILGYVWLLGTERTLKALQVEMRK